VRAQGVGVSKTVKIDFENVKSKFWRTFRREANTKKAKGERGRKVSCTEGQGTTAQKYTNYFTFLESLKSSAHLKI
jgi:hypothetical protein